MALVLAFAALGAPTASVLACSCASLGNNPADAALTAAANGGLGFIGTVVDARPAPPPGDEFGFGDVVAYAFEVERATAPAFATIEVRALNDPGGASCGFVFGIDEEWFVTAYSESGVLHTGLCSGNQRLDAMDPAAAEQLIEVLPEQPVPAEGSDDAASPGGWVLPIAVTVLVVAIAAVSALAFRRRSPDVG